MVAWRLLVEEARLRGFRNPLAFRRWCRRMGVSIRRSGRKEIIVVADVDRAVLGEPASDLERAAEAAVARLYGAG